MSIELKTLQNAAQVTSALLCNEVYGYDPNTFARSITVVDEVSMKVADMPTLTRTGKGAHLTLSVSGARIWAEAIGDSCEVVGVDPVSIYASSGVALLELANVLHYSVRCDDPVTRLRKVDKAFRDDVSSLSVGAVISEHTGIDLSRVISGLDGDDSVTISKLRYGLGVSLKGFGIDKNGKDLFASTSVAEAVNSLLNYQKGVIRFLSDAIYLEDIDLGETSSSEVTEKVHNRDFPFLRIAACVPMNVEYLLNK